MPLPLIPIVAGVARFALGVGAAAIGGAAVERYAKRRNQPRPQQQTIEPYYGNTGITEIAKLHQATLARLGVASSVTSVHRSTAKQAALRRAGGRYPVAAPGRSQHEYGAAYDLVTARPADQKLAQVVGRELGMVSPANDPIHFQLFTAAQFSKLLASGSL